MRAEGKVERRVSYAALWYKLHLFITCELQDLFLLDGVDGTEESGSSETSMLPDKNSNSWIFQREKETRVIREINRLIAKSDRPISLILSHRAHGLLWIRLHRSQLFVHGEDISQVHGVGALQEGLVCLQDEIIVLQACRAGGWQVKFV